MVCPRERYGMPFVSSNYDRVLSIILSLLCYMLYAVIIYHLMKGLLLCQTMATKQQKLQNSLAPGRCSKNIELGIFKLISTIHTLSISCEIALRWMPQDLLMISQHRYRLWLGGVRQQAITWASDDPDLYCHMVSLGHNDLIHWGRVTHICISKITIIGSDNGLSPGRCQVIIWTSAGILLIGPLGTNFNEISIAVQTFSFKKMHLKMSCAKCRPFCLGLNVLRLIRYQKNSFNNGQQVPATSIWQHWSALWRLMAWCKNNPLIAPVPQGWF